MRTGADQPLEWEPEMGTRMSGTSASVQENASRSVCFVLALLIYGANLPRSIGQATSESIKSFHDDALNITYFYSADFFAVPSGAPVAPSGESKCMKSTLFSNSRTAVDRSSFTLSTID